MILDLQPWDLHKHIHCISLFRNIKAHCKFQKVFPLIAIVAGLFNQMMAAKKNFEG